MSESGSRYFTSLVAAGVVGSVLLSLWTLYIDGIINNDGVHYIVTAEHIARGEWADALRTFKWPAYSLLIYLFGLLPGLDYHAAAHVVTTIGFTLAVLGFVAVVAALGGRGRVLWLALVTVLVYPGFNEFRSFLIRDAMFLGFYLFALAALVRFLAAERARDLLLAVGCLLVAALFRVEALAIGLLLPVFPGARRASGRWRVPLAVAYILVVVPLLAIFYGWWLYRPELAGDAGMILSRPFELFARAMDQVFDEFHGHLAAAGGDGGALAGLGTAAWLVLRETVEAISLPFLGILLFETWRRRLWSSWPARARQLIGWLVVLHVVVLFVFAAAKFFLAPRYPVALAVTLILAVPFALDRYLHAVAGLSGPFRRAAAAGGLGLLVAGNAVEGLDNVSDKQYLRDAGIWLKQNAGADYRLASNDLKLVYYAGRYGEKWVAFSDDGEFRDFLRSGHWKHKDYVAVNLKRKDPGLVDVVERTLNQSPVKRFESEKGDVLLVFYTGDD